jgi:hypothetical protein
MDAAEKAFIRERQKADASVAMADYLASEKALRERTAKLRAQRMARDARAKKA